MDGADYKVVAPKELEGEMFKSMALLVSPDAKGRDGDIHIPMAVEAQGPEIIGTFYMLVPKDWAYVSVVVKYGKSQCKGYLHRAINI